MGKCPKCGTEVAKPKKTWKMAGRPDKAGKRMQLEIGLYECPKCGNVFREVLSKQKIEMTKYQINSLFFFFSVSFKTKIDITKRYLRQRSVICKEDL